MSEWVDCTLGDLLTLQRGFDLPVQDRRPGQYPVIASTGQVGTHDSAQVAGPGVVIGRSGSIGGGQYIDEDFWPLNTTLWVADFKGNDPRFCYYLLRSIDFSQFNVGSGVPTLNRNHVHPLRLRAPPARLRKRIGETLGALDDKIELNRQMNKTLEAMARAIFQDWFVDFGPVRRKHAGERDPVVIMAGLVSDAERAAKLAALFPDQMGEELPEGWISGDLSHYADLNPEVWSARAAPAAVRYVDLANTKWGIIESVADFCWDDAPSRARRVARPGDTLVGTVRPGNGSYSFVSVDGLTASTGFAQLRPKTDNLASLVFFSVTTKENIERLSHLADGAAYPAVNPSVVLATELPIIGGDLIAAFDACVSPLHKLMEQYKAEDITLAETRDYLLPRLLSGKVLVAELEASDQQARAS